MKKSGTDILSDRQELRQMPYTTPTGYFDVLKHDLKETSRPAGRGLRKFAPYVALAAAMLTLLFAAGGFYLEHLNGEEFTQEDFILFSDNLTNTIYYDTTEHIADAEIADEEIIEYLIYSGISAEEIENSK